MKSSFLKVSLIVIVCAVIGFFVGAGVVRVREQLHPRANYVGLNKLDALLNLISNKYVEDVDDKALIEKLIPITLEELDPHSVYLTAEDLAKANEDIEGSFSGVGIQFNIREDTVRVVAIVNGGPAERAGLKAGDRIISINDSSFVGDKINNDLVLKTLRGEKQSKVNVGILRYGTDEVLQYSLIRDDIPVNSVDASYRIGDNIAYIKIGNFSRTTYNEFLTIVNRLKKEENCDRLIIDLRGNPGGLMGSALAILNELLPRHRLMLYVEGKSYPREDSYSDGRGAFMDMPVIVLMDEWSASASEILAGAIQDNDRGYIVGRRSYGKGLVQQQIPFKDGSAVRLTVAHYYIPSGRCVQKPYEKGDFEDYEMDLVNRFQRGEFSSADSIHMNDSLIFQTVNGRTVYGGGGIMPDYFVALDTTQASQWYTDVINKNLVYLFSARYADTHRETLNTFKNSESMTEYLEKQNLMEAFVQYATSKGVAYDRNGVEDSRKEVATQIFAYIARNIINEDAFWEMLQKDDETLLKAISLMDGLKTFVE